MAPEDIYVAPGPFLAGGDELAPDAGPRRTVFLPGFILRRTPVTNAEYLTFVNELAVYGPTDEAIRCAPKVAGVAGFTWQPDLPVVLVDRAGALAYTQWLATREGKACACPRRSSGRRRPAVWTDGCTGFRLTRGV